MIDAFLQFVIKLISAFVVFKNDQVEDPKRFAFENRVLGLFFALMAFIFWMVQCSRSIS